MVPFSGVLALAGGISIVIGYKAKWGVWLIVFFLVPVILIMHAFRKVTDPMQHIITMTMFMKNLSMLGGALIIAYFGSGPLSLDNLIKAK